MFNGIPQITMPICSWKTNTYQFFHIQQLLMWELELVFFVFFLCVCLFCGPWAFLSWNQKKVTAQSADWSLISEMLKASSAPLSLCLSPPRETSCVTVSPCDISGSTQHSASSSQHPASWNHPEAPESDGTRLVPSLPSLIPNCIPVPRRQERRCSPWISSLEPGPPSLAFLCLPSLAFLCLLVWETPYILPREHAAFLTHHHPPLNLTRPNAPLENNRQRGWEGEN